MSQADRPDQLELEGFEVFNRRTAPIVNTPFVTLQARGLISLNHAAYESLGQPQAVELLYNRDRKIIALRSADEKSPRSYQLRKQNRGGTFLIAGKAFTTYYQIDTSIARRYAAEVRNGVLLVDLTKQASDATGVRAKRSVP